MTSAQGVATIGTIMGFSFSLGVGTLALPLLALAAGYDAAAVGMLTAFSAVAQFLFRLCLPWLLGRYPDRAIIGVGCLAMGGSYALLLVDTSLLAFLLAQMLQGSSRALFWTASQTHVVRGSSNSVRPLAWLQALGSVGMLVAPAVAGLVATQSLDLALVLGVVSGVVGGGLSLWMRRLTPFDRRTRSRGRHIWRRPGVDVACWSSFATAGWRSMLNSFVPVALTAAGLGPSMVGALLALANLAALAGSGMLIRITPTRSRELVEAAVVMSCVSLAIIPFVAGEAVAVGILMAVGGAGSGILTTLGPSLANDAVAPNERGDAIAATGTFRAAALLATPAGVAGALSIVTLPVALVVASVALAAPVVASGIRARQVVPEGGAS
ncbi:MAG: MFS transporter [Chloroflexi bacterium]|nr:MFS transporter [Chloroflexota bacterium]